MNQQGIRVFLAIVEHKSISGAARALHITQQTVSEYLRQLEKKLGAQLVIRERGARQTMLTSAGDAFVPLAQRWMELDGQTKQFALAQQKRGFRLAASTYGHEHVLSHIVSKLIQKNPELEVRLSNLEFREIPGAIDARAFDAAVCFGWPPKSALVSGSTLFEEERCLLCPADTPLPDRVISTEELDPRFEVYYEVYKRNTAMNKWYAQYLPRKTEPYFRASALASLHCYLTDPRCWAILPVGVVLRLVTQMPDRLTLRRVKPAPPPRACNLLVAKAYPDALVIRDFLACCGEYVDERPYLKKRLEDMRQI